MTVTTQSQHGLTPGVFVRNLAAPDWGIGQVQSAIGNKVTANFDNCGKIVVDTSIVALEVFNPAQD